MVIKYDTPIRNAHLKFAEDRGNDKTYCPSEVARELYPSDWRDKMDKVRMVADLLVMENRLEVLQKSIVKDELPSELRGPIRLRKKL